MLLPFKSNSRQIITLKVTKHRLTFCVLAKVLFACYFLDINPDDGRQLELIFGKSAIASFRLVFCP